jgi:acyl-CoA hydrolase
MYIVTEYGIADVFCKPIPDRVNALIAIAYPGFRSELRKQAVDAGLIRS